MPFAIRRLTDADLDDVVALSLRAWTPVFESLRGALGETVHRQLYPDWRATQARAVEQVCRSATETRVADVEGRPVGFAAVVYHDEIYDEPCSGEIEMIAVDPGRLREGRLHRAAAGPLLPGAVRPQVEAMRCKIAAANSAGACSGIQWVTPGSSTNR